ncbi:MAG: STAS domain-containing protein [Nitrospirota bacterium]
MIESIKHIGDEIVLVTLTGELTISYIDGLKESLVDILNKDTYQIVLDVEKVIDVDISCLQLLCSVHRTSNRMEKRLMLNGKSSEVFKRIVKDAGYSRHVGCALDCNKNCLWIGWEES